MEKFSTFGVLVVLVFTTNVTGTSNDVLSEEHLRNNKNLSQDVEEGEIGDGTPTIDVFSESKERSIPPSASWKYYDRSGNWITYLVNTVPPLNLNDAKMWCEHQGQGFRLASFIDKDAFKFITEQLKSFVGSQRYNRAAFWTAGVDLIIGSTRGEGQYWLYSGISVDTSYWNVGEPNDLSRPETCIDIKVKAGDVNGNYGLNDESCLSLTSYICQAPGIVSGKPIH